jgi:hypothetical protein
LSTALVYRIRPIGWPVLVYSSQELEAQEAERSRRTAETSALNTSKELEQRKTQLAEYAPTCSRWRSTAACHTSWPDAGATKDSSSRGFGVVRARSETLRLVGRLKLKMEEERKNYKRMMRAQEATLQANDRHREDMMQREVHLREQARAAQRMCIAASAVASPLAHLSATLRPARTRAHA